MTELTTLQKALLTIKKLKQQLQQQTLTFRPIAIIGVACRFPQADNKDQFWQLLLQGKNVIRKLPTTRWDLLNGSSEMAKRDVAHPYFGGYLDNIDAFDPYFFGITPREALRMDPQQRLLLEVAYEAIEDAGITLPQLQGSNTGVFTSLYASQFAHLQQLDSPMDALYLPTGNASSMAANRLSYLYDLHGPSVVLDTACSSSLVATHLACLHLQTKACDVALVCGANINLLPSINLVLAQANMLAPDGQCKTFDASANGYVQGEGVGVMILKPLATALRDRDHIYAVINGGAINQDGKTNGLTAPNGLQQELLLKKTCQSAGIDPQQLSYIECHGTGTFLGDPIEVQALGAVAGKNRSPEQTCYLGSVKTNLGHLEPAAGMASLIKLALALKHKQIPPHLNVDTLNPHVAFDKYQFKVAAQIEPWPLYGEFRCAAVSGFGFGGTNAQLLVREVLPHEAYANLAVRRELEIFTLTAKNETALLTLLSDWYTYLHSHSNIDLAQICYHLHLRRTHYAHRVALIVTSVDDLKNKLQPFQANDRKISADDNIFFSTSDKSKEISSAERDITQSSALDIAKRFVAGSPINWTAYEQDRFYAHVNLPRYPWQRKKYWPPMQSVPHAAHNTYPLAGLRLRSPAAPLQYAFTLAYARNPEIKDTFNVLHIGYYLDMLGFIVNDLTKQTGFSIQAHEFLTPIFLLIDAVLQIVIQLEKTAEHAYQYQIFTEHADTDWILHARGCLSLATAISPPPRRLDALETQLMSPASQSAEHLYQHITAMGMPTGESIRWTKQYAKTENNIVCKFIQPATTIAHNAAFALRIHPGVFDAALQPVFMLLPEELLAPYIGSYIESATLYPLIEDPTFLHGNIREVSNDGKLVVVNSTLMDKQGNILVEFRGVKLTQLEHKTRVDNILQQDERIDLTTLPVSERQQRVQLFLVTHVAHLFSMPETDVNIHLSLSAMGLDSLLALVLMKTLEAGLGLNCSVSVLLSGISIAALAAHLLPAAAPPPADAMRWLAYRQPRAQAQYRLFCFPYGGGGASIYRDWQRQLPDHIEVCPVQLPGRENRLAETPRSDLPNLIAELAHHLQSELTMPFVFFGHSLGALLAFELTRYLRLHALPQPQHLFASAFPDPRLPSKSLDNLLQQLEELNINLFAYHHPALIEKLSAETLSGLAQVLARNGIAEYGDHLLDKDIAKILLPIFSGDMGLVKSYVYQPQEKLSMPLTVFAGRDDTWVKLEDHVSWQDHTSQHCALEIVESGHLFIRDENVLPRILHIIKQTLMAN